MSKLINISVGVSLALHGLAIIAAQHPKRINVKYLANQLDASEAHLAKIFKLLTKSNIIKSFRGPNGGFTLNKSAEDIDFLYIYEIVESKIELNKCPLNKQTCVFKKCIFGDKFNGISKEIYNTFKNIKLSDFFISKE